MRYLLSLTLGVFMVMGSLAQTTVTIEGGADDVVDSDFYLPANGNYEYNWSAIIYLQSDIGIAGDISEISFYISLYADGGSSYSMDNQKIYMAHTASDEFSNTDKPDPSSMTKVYDGNITWSGTGWYSITLDTEFYYDNSDNLMIYYENHNGDFTWDYPEFRYTLLQPFYAKEDHADGSLPTGSGTEMNRPDIKLVITESTLPVELLDFNANFVDSDATITWTTATEVNNDYFIVERSNDMVNFTEIARIEGQGFSHIATDYTYVEEDVPDKKNYYYRLSQVDFNRILLTQPPGYQP